MELDKHYKVRVNPEQSRKIQELLFALGGCWLSGSHFKEPIMLYADYLFLNKLMVLTCASEHGDCYFENKHTHTEIQAGELIALLTDLSKSAENPPQGMELTPEFETEASEPKFKVGDKVYLFGTDYIEEITKIIGANVYLAGADFDASVSIKEICHATQENYEMLCNLYPHIEFEQPAKELKGSDLARALIKKGWVGFNCLCGNSGDGHVITETIVTGINNSGQFTTVDGRLFNNAVPMNGWRPLTAQQVGL